MSDFRIGVRRSEPPTIGAIEFFSIGWLVFIAIVRNVRRPLNMRAPRIVTHWMPAIGWMVLIFIGSTDALSAEHTSRFLMPFLYWLDPRMPIATVMLIMTLVRKLGHVTEYAVLAVLLWRAFRGPKTNRIWLAFGVAWGVCALFAASDEFHQSFVPSRTASAHDVMIDICGALIGLLICWGFATRKRAIVEG